MRKAVVFAILLVVSATLAIILSVAYATLAIAGGNTEKPVLAKTTSSTSADKAAIANLWANYSKFVIDGNVAGYLSLHDHDAYKMPQDKPMFKLWADASTVRKSWAKASELYTAQMRIDPMEIVIMGDYAYTMGTYYKKSTPKSGGTALVADGKFLTVLHKDSSGAWKILRDGYNNNTPAGS